ncbi:TM0026 family membrane protein [Pseudothermotoga thermarum]
MFTKALITLFAWALVLEVLVLLYYLWRGFRPVEFYLNIFLMIFTIPILVFLIFREKRRRKDEGGE